MPSSTTAKPAAALSREQADDVLRYWLAALRLEEALQVRPMARPAVGGVGLLRLDHPTAGQEYFKLPLDRSVAGLLADQTEVKRAFDAELGGFFETWLHGQYRRGEDETELSHLLCFPVVHLPNGELAGLVRCGVRLRFGTAGSKPFRAPTRAERQQGAYPPPPDEARVTRAPRPDAGWPFFLDTRLLHRTLAVPTEGIDALFEALRLSSYVSERQMLALLTLLLEEVADGGLGEPESVSAHAARLEAAALADASELEAWLERLLSVLRRQLAQRSARARVYSVGVVVDGTRAKTTWHLQREVEALIAGERGPWKIASPLGAYLTGQPLPTGAAPQRALFPGPALTSSQRDAAEQFWGARLSSVQGPPGTGKTRLILHVCAEATVRQVEALLAEDRARAELFLITSSNNRAVDNVMEPLSGVSGLPLGLRAGSRQACEQHLLHQLRRTVEWLQHVAGEPLPARNQRLARAKARFRAALQAVEQRLAPRRAALAREHTRARLAAELALCAAPDGDEAGWEPSRPHAKALLLAVEPLERRLRELSKLCEVSPTAAAASALPGHFKRTAKRYWPPVKQALDHLELTLELPVPPPLPASPATPAQQMEAWEEAAELSLSRLAELRSSIERALARKEVRARAATLRAQLTGLGPGPAALPEVVDETYEREARELFDAAIAGREAWAGEHADELLRAVSIAAASVEQERSLRPLFRDDPSAARLLCSLFGIWGSTLLSLGNCFPTDLGKGARVVIDEAGQCHPAHAVSGLLRAQSALVIGDVHQLSPVIELSVDDDARALHSCRLATPAERLRPYRINSDAITSTQSLADRAVRMRGELTDHFRCQPEIIAVSDALCAYGLTTHTPREDRSRYARYLQQPLLLVDLRGEQARFGGSWCNELEAAETLALAESLLCAGLPLDDLAVITPYRGQLERLRRGFLDRRIALEVSPELAESGVTPRTPSGLALGTVHRFQGGERSVVLFSSVVSHESGLGFLNARPNLLNVALSRARHHFVCLGNAAVLAQGTRSRLLVDGVTRLAPAAYA